MGSRHDCVIKILLWTIVITLTLLMGVSMATVCVNGSDCHEAQCCVMNKTTGTGDCKLMRRTAWSCYVKQPYAWKRPEAMVTDFDLCPCAVGEFCGLMPGEEHPKYGQMGICMFG